MQSCHLVVLASWASRPESGGGLEQCPFCPATSQAPSQLSRSFSSQSSASQSRATEDRKYKTRATRWLGGGGAFDQKPYLCSRSTSAIHSYGTYIYTATLAISKSYVPTSSRLP